MSYDICIFRRGHAHRTARGRSDADDSGTTQAYGIIDDAFADRAAIQHPDVCPLPSDSATAATAAVVEAPRSSRKLQREKPRTDAPTDATVPLSGEPATRAWGMQDGSAPVRSSKPVQVRVFVCAPCLCSGHLCNCCRDLLRFSFFASP